MITSCNDKNFKPSFKGWDASRPVKALQILAPKDFKGDFVSLMQELGKIGKKENFDVFDFVFV